MFCKILAAHTKLEPRFHFFLCCWTCRKKPFFFALAITSFTLQNTNRFVVHKVQQRNQLLAFLLPNENGKVLALRQFEFFHAPPWEEAPREKKRLGGEHKVYWPFKTTNVDKNGVRPLSFEMGRNEDSKLIYKFTLAINDVQHWTRKTGKKWRRMEKREKI